MEASDVHPTNLIDSNGCGWG